MTVSRKLLKLAVVVASLSVAPFGAAKALKMDVYTTQDAEVYAPMGRKLSAFNVHYIDGLKNKESQITEMLPKDPELAQQRLREFVDSGEYKMHAQELANGWMTISAVANNGIEKIPAIVINDRFIAYGVTPKVALKHYDAYILKYGSK